jgi:hypothetical protein
MIKREFLNRLIEWLVLLYLENQHIVFGKGNLHAFVFVQVCVPRIQMTRIVFIQVFTPFDFQFYVVVLNRHDWKTRLPRLTKEETKGVKERTRTYTPVKTRWIRFSIRGRQKIDGNVFTELGVLTIHQLTTYVKLDLIYHGSPIVNQLCDPIQLYVDVTVSQQISGTFKHDTRRSTRFRNTLDGLLLCKRGEIAVSLE